ncbi:MAG: hypothetical protein GY930_00065 [bacterium]|nr:hypothetical protein [bacterium]
MKSELSIVGGLVLAAACIALWWFPARSSGSNGHCQGHTIGIIDVNSGYSPSQIATALTNAGFTADTSREFHQALPAGVLGDEPCAGALLFTKKSTINGFTFLLGVSKDPAAIYYCETHSGSNEEVARMGCAKVQQIEEIKTELRRH